MGIQNSNADLTGSDKDVLSLILVGGSVRILGISYIVSQMKPPIILEY